jgi:hypothetical protein
MMALFEGLETPRHPRQWFTVGCQGGIAWLNMTQTTPHNAGGWSTIPRGARREAGRPSCSTWTAPW